MDHKLVEDHDPSITATTSGEQNRTNQNNRISNTECDQRIVAVRRKYTELTRQFQSINQENSQVDGEPIKLTNVLRYIDNSYFYETLTQFGPNIRLSHFYNSLEIGDRFVAKVVNVFERCADVILFWSPKRDIRDLKIKAYLRLVDSKRYSNGGRNRNSNRSNNFSVRNIEVSELIYVELDYISSDRKNIEVIRCKTLSPEADQTVDDNDVDELDEDRFKSKSLERTTFHDYMMDHDNLRNPYLTKQPPFTSLLYGSQFVDCYRRKLEQRKLTKRKSNESTNVKDDELVILNDTGKSSNQKAESRNEPFSDRSRRPTFSISSERTPNLKKSSLQSSSIIRVPSTSHSSSSLSDSDSSSSSSSSSSVSDSSRRHKRKRKKSKHHHRTSKKSKKSKKKKKLKKSSMKHNRSKDDDEKRHRNSKKKKIDHKILELLKMAK